MVYNYFEHKDILKSQQEEEDSMTKYLAEQAERRQIEQFFGMELTIARTQNPLELQRVFARINVFENKLKGYLLVKDEMQNQT